MVVGLAYSLIFTSLREAELRTSGVPPGISWFLQLTSADLTLLGSATAADSCLLSLHYRTGAAGISVKYSRAD